MSKTATGLPLSISLEIPATWTPEQARAIVELLDDLQDKIWYHYSLQLLDQFSQHCRPASILDDIEDPPF